MFHFCKNNQIIKLLTAASLLAITASVFANKIDNQISNVLSTIPSNVTNANAHNVNKSSPNSSVVLDFSIAVGESWDAKDSANNVITNCVNGSSITGFSYSDVTINTVAGSFFSEAVIYFSDSNGNNGLRLTTGAGDDTSGTKSFSSNGVLDLTDNGLEDIVSLSDDSFLIQLYENIDDAENAIDARYTDGTVTVLGVDLVPSNDCPFLMGKGESNSDLSVTYTVDQVGDYSLYDALEFNVLINNNGVDTATNVSLNNSLSEKLAFNQMTCNDGTSTTDLNDILSLNVQDITNSSSLVCTIDTTIIAYGTIQSSITVNADNDSNISNNSATVMARGAFRIVPVNNTIALLMLALAFVFFVRKRIS